MNPESPPEFVREVDELNKKIQEIARTGSTPNVALNALLTAYLNTAIKVGALANVPDAAEALGTTARHLLAMRPDQAKHLVAVPSTH